MIDLALLSFVVGAGFGEETGAMVVDVGVEVVLIEGVDQRRPVLRDVAIAEQFF